MGEFEDRELWKAIQNYLITSWKLPAYEKWLNVMLLSGRITLKNRPTVPLDVNQEMKYQDVAFTGRRWQGIQPKEEALANQINLEMRITSPQRVIQSRGDDPDEILDEWVKWGEKLSNNGLQSPNDVEVMSDDDEEDDETTE
jgi:capsid protein